MDMSEIWSKMYSNKNGKGTLIVTDPKGEIAKLSEEEQLKLFQKISYKSDATSGE